MRTLITSPRAHTDQSSITENSSETAWTELQTFKTLNVYSSYWSSLILWFVDEQKQESYLQSSAFMTWSAPIAVGALTDRTEQSGSSAKGHVTVAHPLTGLTESERRRCSHPHSIRFVCFNTGFHQCMIQCVNECFSFFFCITVMNVSVNLLDHHENNSTMRNHSASRHRLHFPCKASYFCL